MAHFHTVTEQFIPRFEAYQLLTWLGHLFEYPWEETSKKSRMTTEAVFETELNQNIEIPPLKQRQEEYTQLFISHIPHMLAPPYEVFYADKGRDVLGSLYRWYSLFSFIYARERADHIVAELQFTALLSKGRKWKMAYDFVEEHLYQWIIPFTEKMMQNANTRYYPSMGKLAAHLIERIRRAELL